jgi:hypothetical protein
MRQDDERTTEEILAARDIQQTAAEAGLRALSEAVGAIRRLSASAWGSFLAEVEQSKDPAKVTLYRRVEWATELDPIGALRSPLLEVHLGADLDHDTSGVIAEAISVRRVRFDEEQRERMRTQGKALLAEHPELKYLIEAEVEARVGVAQRPRRV